MENAYLQQHIAVTWSSLLEKFLMYLLDTNGNFFGVWGGETEKQTTDSLTTKVSLQKQELQKLKELLKSNNAIIVVTFPPF